MSMSGNSKRPEIQWMKARYISDVKSDLVKGEVYDVFYPIGDTKKLLVGYIDKWGEEYAVPSIRFEILEDKGDERMTREEKIEYWKRVEEQFKEIEKNFETE